MQFLQSIFEWVFADPAADPIDWFTRGGTIGILAYGVLAFMRGWIVPGSAVKERLAEKDAQLNKAMELVYEHAKISMRALEVGAKKNGNT